ncbi:hypothetical protein L6R29_11145 [Myxococcota bacterium]|nr:hypothetical protein [Myxococcota bacterium]
MFTHKHSPWWSLLGLGCFFWAFSSMALARPLPKEPLLRRYLYAVQMYYKNQSNDSRMIFLSVQQSLQQSLFFEKDTSAFPLYRLLRLDVDHFLARIDWESKAYVDACRQLGRLLGQINAFPPQRWLELRRISAQSWEKHGLEAGLIERLDAASRTYHEECPKIPTRLHFQIIPPHAVVHLRDQSGRWQRLRTRQAEVRGRIIVIRTRAQGHQSDLRTLAITPGVRQFVSIQLRKRDSKTDSKDDPTPTNDPTKRPADPTTQQLTQRTKPPTKPLAIYQQWWFWTAIGVAVVTAAVTTSVAVVLSQPNEQLRGKNDTPFRLWDR